MPFLYSIFKVSAPAKKLESWFFQAACFFQKKSLSGFFFVKKLQELEFSASPEKQQERLETLLLVFLFFESKIYAMQGLFSPSYENIIKESPSEEVLSIFYLKKLCKSFWEKEKDFSFCREKKNWEAFSFFHPHFSIKGVLYQCLWAFFCKQEYEVIEKQLSFYEDLLDYYGRPFPSLWALEESYDPFSVYLDYYLLFFTVGTLFKRGDLLQKIENWKPYLEKDPENFSKKEWILALFLENWVENQKPFPSSFIPKKASISPIFFPEKGVLGRRFSHVSYLFTLGGNNSSLGAFQGKEIKIPSFGLQKELKSLSKGMGLLKRTPLLEKDFAIQSHTNILSLSGWTALQESSTWVKLDIKAFQEKVDFTLFFLEKEPLYFLFCLEAEKAFFQEEVLYPKSLKKSKETARSVTFQKDQEKWRLSSMQDSLIEVIPLSGEKGFWNSSFLVAFPVKGGEKNRFSVEFLQDL